MMIFASAAFDHWRKSFSGVMPATKSALSFYKKPISGESGIIFTDFMQ